LYITDYIEKHGFVYTVELTPPVVFREKFEKKVQKFSKLFKFMNFTDFQRGTVKVTSLVAAIIAKDYGVEPVIQLTGRDRNRIAIQGELLSAYAMGIENVLCLTGDHTSLGGDDQAKYVGDVDSVQMLKLVELLSCGELYGGKKLRKKVEFCAGAALNHYSEPRELNIFKLHQKERVGARFFQTQPVFDAEEFLKFLEEAKLKVPVIAGIMPVRNLKMAEFLDKNLSGVKIPEQLMERLSNGEDYLDIFVEILRVIKPHIAGVHFMMAKYDEVAYIVDKVG